jgi:hypothetical protein
VREFVKSFFSLGIAASLFPLKQMENILTPTERGEDKGPATKAMDAVSNATVEQFGGVLRGTFSALDNVQRGLVNIGYAMLWPSGTGSRQTQGVTERHTGYDTTRPNGEPMWPEAAPSDITAYRGERFRTARSPIITETDRPARRNGGTTVPASRRA